MCDQRMAQMLIAQLEKQDIEQITGLMYNPPENEQYKAMKERLITVTPDVVLRCMWTNHLPALIRSVLAVSESFSNKTTLEELALLADRIMDQNCKIAAVFDICQSFEINIQPFGKRFVVERQIRGSAVGCMLHVNACCRQASTTTNSKLMLRNAPRLAPSRPPNARKLKRTLAEAESGVQEYTHRL
ncbi:hypothetical protein EVAR_37272_1 [Eumeta japonica]|uniref:Uncharacterized protein n=1 Tax=Eumeta variegata TaxID=151549 RepID=A0A4C1WJ09_EUMVA|nr:hypothetical protein EVAR_37272_1 [Eumeta japonica]